MASPRPKNDSVLTDIDEDTNFLSDPMATDNDTDSKDDSTYAPNNTNSTNTNNNDTDSSSAQMLDLQPSMAKHSDAIPINDNYNMDTDTDASFLEYSDDDTKSTDNNIDNLTHTNDDALKATHSTTITPPLPKYRVCYTDSE